MEPALRNAVRLAAEELAEAILPAVLTQLRDQTGRLQHLADRISHDPREALVDPTGVESLEADQVLGRRIGWCLGVLAAANGTDLLLARRERDGLRDMLELVAQATPEHPPEPSLEGLPRLATSPGEGWEVPLLAATAFWHAARTLPAGASLVWKLKSAADSVSLHLSSGADAFPAELLGLVPGAELARDDGFTLSFPRDWFA